MKIHRPGPENAAQRSSHHRSKAIIEEDTTKTKNAQKSSPIIANTGETFCRISPNASQIPDIHVQLPVTQNEQKLAYDPVQLPISSHSTNAISKPQNHRLAIPRKHIAPHIATILPIRKEH